MEKTKKSGEILWSSDDLEGSDSGSSQVKSYTCAFCKRGFSNAQALGGHMNIHRKDRAKLRQFSEENLLSLDIAMPNIPIEDSEETNVVILESSEDQIFTPKSHNKEEKMKQLLVESSSSNIDKYLDLELRLGGPVPREPSDKITKDLFRSSSH